MGHQRDQERRGDVLIGAHRQRVVAVGIGAQRLRHEGVPRHLAHDLEHARVELLDAGLGAQHRDLKLDDPDHLVARRDVVGLGVRRARHQAAEQAQQTSEGPGHYHRRTSMSNPRTGACGHGHRQLNGKAWDTASHIHRPAPGRGAQLAVSLVPTPASVKVSSSSTCGSRPSRTCAAPTP